MTIDTKENQLKFTQTHTRFINNGVSPQTPNSV